MSDDKQNSTFIPKGYVLKPRAIQDSWITHAAPVVREIWDWLVLNANHKNIRYRGFEVQRGQLFASNRDIREGLCWYVGYRKSMYSENQTKHAMKLLKSHGMITTTSNPRGTLITICNYSKYQDPVNYESTNVPTSEQLANDGVINQPSPPINKNEKNEKNGRMEITQPPLLLDEQPVKADFDENFWSKYPKKVDKKEARALWEKLPASLQREISAHLDVRVGPDPEQPNDAQWSDSSNGRFQYVPSPARFLRREKWKDQWQPRRSDRFSRTTIKSADAARGFVEGGE